MPHKWVRKIRSASGWTAVIFAFVFLFFWQMTSAVMPTLDRISHEKVAGPFADSPIAITATIASLLILIAALIVFLISATATVILFLRERGQAKPDDAGVEQELPPVSGNF